MTRLTFASLTLAAAGCAAAPIATPTPAPRAPSAVEAARAAGETPSIGADFIRWMGNHSIDAVMLVGGPEGGVCRRLHFEEAKQDARLDWEPEEGAVLSFHVVAEGDTLVIEGLRRWGDRTTLRLRPGVIAGLGGSGPNAIKPPEPPAGPPRRYRVAKRSDEGFTLDGGLITEDAALCERERPMRGSHVDLGPIPAGPHRPAWVTDPTRDRLGFRLAREGLVWLREEGRCITYRARAERPASQSYALVEQEPGRRGELAIVPIRHGGWYVSLDKRSSVPNAASLRKEATEEAKSSSHAWGNEIGETTCCDGPVEQRIAEMNGSVVTLDEGSIYLTAEACQRGR